MTPKPRAETDFEKKSVVQVMKVRHMLRKKSYFGDVDMEKEHTNLEGMTMLSEDILKLQAIGTSNIKLHVKNKENNENHELKFVSVTAEEQIQKEDVGEKTIAQLKKMIFEIIFILPLHVQDTLEDMFRTNAKTKEEHVEFYYEVNEMTQYNEVDGEN